MLLVITLFSCNKDETLVNDTNTQTHSHEGPQGFITFETLSRNIGNSNAYNANVNYLDKNVAGLQARGGGLVNAYIDTNTIYLIEADGINYYTLKIINNNPEEKANTFYNLIFTENLDTGEVTSSIFQYNPDLKWIFDKSKPFEGKTIMFDNTEITLDDLENGAHLEGGRGIAMCPWASAEWVCTGDGNHPGRDGCTVGGWVITYGSTPCTGTGSSGSGGNGDGDNGDGSTGGGSNGSGNTQTVVLEVCNGFNNPDDEDSEDCEDELAYFLTNFTCEPNSNDVDFINDWMENNEETSLVLANYLATNFSNDCADIDVKSLLQLTDALEANPYLLLDCTQIVNWQTLAQHTAPTSVKNKINNLPSGTFNDFYIQTLEDAGGTMVNMDYFPVKITTLPYNPITGQRFTADGLLDYFRRHINNFVDDTTFVPYCEIQDICQQEIDLWNSNNPLGALQYINITIDPGTVILTEFEHDYWYFMTMNAPGSGNHPVAGTRQFGYEQNNDGSYNFFVRGVDRFDSNMVENLAYIVNRGEAFANSDDLWESFQRKFDQFVTVRGGVSSIITPDKDNRPDWDKVEMVLKGELPIGDLGCN